MNAGQAGIVGLLLLVAACEQSGSNPAFVQRDSDVDSTAPQLRPSPSTTTTPAGSWAEDEGRLSFLTSDGAPLLRLSCAPESATLSVNLPAARSIGSEERMSFGGAGEVTTLVADTEGDSQQGGVTGTGKVPLQLEAMLSAGPGASYGATVIGPMPKVEAEVARRFVAQCRTAQPAPSPCRIQDGKPLTDAPLRALGTEPFWNADVEGRCVTYQTPEDMQGKRVWTRMSWAGNERRYAGALDGKPFRLAIRPAPGCSDGMSDRRFAYSSTLEVNGEVRRGCALKR